MTKSTLLKIYNQFTQLDANRMSLIIYEPNWNQFHYIQPNKTIVITTLSDLVIPTSNLEYAVLTPNGYKNLMETLNELITDDRIMDDNTLLVPKELGFDVYQSRTSKLFPYPIKVASIKPCDITNKLIISIMHKIMYKRFNNPLIKYKKSNKSPKGGSS